MLLSAPIIASPLFCSMAYRRTTKSQKGADLCPSITEAAHTWKTEHRTGIVNLNN
jgi:hypothetical protein